MERIQPLRMQVAQDTVLLAVLKDSLDRDVAQLSVLRIPQFPLFVYQRPKFITVKSKATGSQSTLLFEVAARRDKKLSCRGPHMDNYSPERR